MKQNTHDKKRQNDKPKDPFGFQDALNLEVLDNMSNEELEELSKILDKLCKFFIFEKLTILIIKFLYIL